MARKIKKINWEGPLPKCDICTVRGYRPVRDAPYDTPTIDGPWANVCHTHLLQFSPRNCTLVAKRVIGYHQPPTGEVLL